MGKLMRNYLWLLIWVTSTAHAQFFNSNAFQLTLGWTGFDTTASFLRPIPDPNKWPTTDQAQIGLGYQYALSGYSLWWVTQSALTLGYARNYGLPNTQVLAGINALTGLRYNFSTQAWRPFILGGIGLLTLFTNPNATLQTNNVSKQAWMMVQLGPGIEYIFADEMSLQLDTGALAFFDFATASRFSYTVKLSYLFYF